MGTVKFFSALLLAALVSGFANQSELSKQAASSVQAEFSARSNFKKQSSSVAKSNAEKVYGKNVMDELDPFASDIREQLQALDQQYYQATGKIPFIGDEFEPFDATSCFQIGCKVWAQVSRDQQRMNLYVDQKLYATWATSTGAAGHETPNFDRHPNGRIYDAYSSKKYPGGDYNGLGNMPYAVFIEEGFAVHGTGRNNWPLLGKPASHGCVRIHPDNAYIFNRMVRQNGIANVWITIGN